MCAACPSAGLVAPWAGCARWGCTLVWCPKYRRRILGGRVAARCGELLEQIADEHGWEIVATEVMPDHGHLFVRVGPTDASAQVVRAFTGRTARVLRSEFPYLRRFAKVLWSPSYVAASVGLCLGVDGAPRHRAPVGRGGVVRRAYVFRLRPDRAPACRVGAVPGCAPRVV